MKKLTLSFVLCFSFATASTCTDAKQQAEYYSIKANNYNMSSISGACAIADNLEQVVNWMGTMKNNNCPSFNNSTYQLYISMLMSATTKCGH